MSLSGPTFVVPVMTGLKNWRQFADGPTLDPCDSARFHTVDFNVQRLFGDSVMQQINHVWSLGEKPGHILLGRDCYTQFLPETATDIDRSSAFDMPFEWASQYLRPATVFQGIRIHMIPWMEGLVVTPKLCPCGSDLGPQAAEDGSGAIGLPANTLVGIEDTLSADSIARITEWLKGAADRWADNHPKRFVRTRKFLWIWY
jgi:hypothetical protein